MADPARISDLNDRIKQVPLSFFLATDLTTLDKFLRDPFSCTDDELDLIEQRLAHFEAYKAAMVARRQGGHQCGCKGGNKGGGCQDSGGCGSKKDDDG